MHYVLIYDVVEDYMERRTPHRPEHLALAQAHVDRGELVLAGALNEPTDSTMMVFKADSPAVAEAFAAADPYVRHGVVRQWRVRPWSTVIGTAMV